MLWALCTLTQSYRYVKEIHLSDKIHCFLSTSFHFFPFLNQQTTDILWLILFCFFTLFNWSKTRSCIFEARKEIQKYGHFCNFSEGLKYQEIQDCTDTEGCFKLQGSRIVKLRCFTIKKTRSIQVHSFIINKMVLVSRWGHWLAQTIL